MLHGQGTAARSVVQRRPAIVCARRPTCTAAALEALSRSCPAQEPREPPVCPIGGGPVKVVGIPSTRPVCPRHDRKPALRPLRQAVPVEDGVPRVRRPRSDAVTPGGVGAPGHQPPHGRRGGDAAGIGGQRRKSSRWGPRAGCRSSRSTCCARRAPRRRRRPAQEADAGRLQSPGVLDRTQQAVKLRRVRPTVQCTAGASGRHRRRSMYRTLSPWPLRVQVLGPVPPPWSLPVPGRPVARPPGRPAARLRAGRAAGGRGRRRLIAVTELHDRRGPGCHSGHAAAVSSPGRRQWGRGWRPGEDTAAAWPLWHPGPRRS